MARFVVNCSFSRSHLSENVPHSFELVKCESSINFNEASKSNIFSKISLGSIRNKLSTLLNQNAQLDNNVTSFSKMCNQHNLAKCQTCGTIFRKISWLLLHRYSKHRNVKTYNCHKCQKLFVRLLDLKRHIINTHKVIVNTKSKKSKVKIEIKKEPVVINKKRCCDVCKSTETDLYPVNDGIIQLVCIVCFRVCFTKKKKQEAQQRALAETSPEFMCEFCGLPYRRFDYLRQHQIRAHTNEKPFECSRCHLKFVMSCDLASHMKVHNQPRNHKCDVCGKAFNRSTHLKTHYRIHTGEKPHVCQICGRGFSQKICLTQHQKTHR